MVARLKLYAGTTEKEFQDLISRTAWRLGWSVYHTFDSRRSAPGFPDLVLVHPQRGVIFAEIKRLSGRLRPEQKEWLHRLHQAGATVFVWRPHQFIEISKILTG